MPIESSPSLDLVEDASAAQSPALEGGASASREPGVAAATPDTAPRERAVKDPSPDTAARLSDPRPVTPRGLGTLSSGSGVWPANIPHHLGKITGSRHGGVAVWGELPEASIRRRVGEHSPSILRCYSEGLSAIPNLAGCAIVRFIIERDGRVQRVNTLGSDLPAKSVLRCLERLFRPIRFPEPDAGTVTVTYPLPLSSTQETNWETIP